MTRTVFCRAWFLCILAGMQACEGGATVLDGADAQTMADGGDGCDPTDGGDPQSWCGAPDDVVCCAGSSGTPLPNDDYYGRPGVEPLPQPVVGADDATVAFIAGSPADVIGIWRGVTTSDDGAHPSRVTLEAPSVGALMFDFTRAVADFPILPDGTEVRISAAPPLPYCVGPYCWQWEAAGSVRLTLADGTLVAAVALGCDAGPPGTLPTIMAPVEGHAGDVDCREPAPIWSTGGWCYVGRTRRAVVLDGVAAPVAPNATARVRVGSTSYEFTNHRYALQDSGGPHIRHSCLPGIPALCVFSVYAVVE